MSTAKEELQTCQAVLNVPADGIPGPVTDAAWAAMNAAAAAGLTWPVPTPQTPVVPQGGASLVGFDSVEPISAAWIARATTLMGSAPKFCGRYFGPGPPSPYEYQHAVENGPARAANCPILPIGDQTNRVAGPTGASDGAGNAADVISTFGADYLASIGKEFYLVLDVEGQPSLSVAYYIAWSAAVITRAQQLSGGRFTLLPCVYASENDGPTWKALASSMLKGAVCAGAWVASYVTTTAVNLPIDPAWNPSKARMNTGDDTPAPTCPVLLWQEAGGFDGTPYEALDPNIVSPNIDSAAFLSRLILPPASIA